MPRWCRDERLPEVHTCTTGRIPLTDQQIGGYSLSGCCPISPYTSHPASQASPRGSSHSKEPKPGRPRLTYLITADPAWSGWGSEWVASVVRLLRTLRIQTRLPRTHGTWSATHTKAAWHDHAVDHHLSGRYFMAIGRFIFISICNSGTACRICSLLLVLQRSSTGDLDLFLRDFLLPWY